MAKNLIPQIAQMLGVELGEEFKVVYKTGFEIICNFTMAGLFVHKGDSGKYEKELLADIICGKAEIVKLPWKPKEGTEVYTFSFTTYEYNSRFCPHKGVWYVTEWNWAGFPWQIAALDKGWVYRTRAEAQAALPKVAAEMGVKYALQGNTNHAKASRQFCNR